MPQPLDRNEVQQRLHNFPRDTYLFIGAINKGIALTLASVAILPMLFNLGEYGYRLGPWLGSMMALLVAHVTWSRGVVLTNARTNLLDTILPLVMGLFEIALFAVLIDDPNKVVPDTAWHQWFLVSGCHGICASFLVWNRMRNTVIDRDFDKPRSKEDPTKFQPPPHDLQPLGVRYMEWMRLDRMGAAWHGGVSLGVWALMAAFVLRAPERHGWGIPLYSGLAAFGGLVLLKPILDADRQRRFIETYVNPPDESPSHSSE